MTWCLVSTSTRSDSARRAADSCVNVAVERWRSPSDANRLVGLVRDACPRTSERVDEGLTREAVPVADELRLTVYDAAYVAVSRRRGWTLVSGDIDDLVEPGFAVPPDGVVMP